MNERTIRLLVTGEHHHRTELGVESTETNGVYGQVRTSMDTGRVAGIVSAIDLERLIELIDDDEAVKAAVQLAALGWKPEALGGLFHPRLSRNRPGRKLLNDGILSMAARSRQKRLEAEARRAELRA